jgi:hypothetical protein
VDLVTFCIYSSDTFTEDVLESELDVPVEKSHQNLLNEQQVTSFTFLLTVKIIQSILPILSFYRSSANDLGKHPKVIITLIFKLFKIMVTDNKKIGLVVANYLGTMLDYVIKNSM